MSGNFRSRCHPIGALPRRCSPARIDVLFRSLPSPSLKFPLRKQIVLVPDLQHEEFPQFFTATELAERRRNFPASHCRQRAIATISEHARSMIATHHHAIGRYFFDASGRSVRPQPDLRGNPTIRAGFARCSLLLFRQYLAPQESFGPLECLQNLQNQSAARQFARPVHPDGWVRWPRGTTRAVTHLGFVSRNELALSHATRTLAVRRVRHAGPGSLRLRALCAAIPRAFPKSQAAALLQIRKPRRIVRSMAAIADNDTLRAALIAKVQRFKAYGTGRHWHAASLAACSERTPSPIRRRSEPARLHRHAILQPGRIHRPHRQRWGKAIPDRVPSVDGGSTERRSMAEVHGGRLD